MRSQTIIYIFLILLILSNIFQLIQKAHTIYEKKQAESLLVVWNGSSSCYFIEFPVRFSIPTCEKYSAGEVLQIELGGPVVRGVPTLDEKISSTTSIFHSGGTLVARYSEPQEFQVSKLTVIQPSRFHPHWWASHLARLSHRFREIILHPLSVLPSDQELLARKLFIGSLEKLSKSQTDQMKVLGISHVFAVSGFHVSLFFMLVSQLFFKVGKPLRFFLSIGVGGLMLLLAGTAASIVRAVIMLIIVQWGRSNGRKVSLFRTLLLTLLVSLCIKPAWLWDIGWQLSYTAMLALVWLNPEIDLSIKRIVFIISRTDKIIPHGEKFLIRPIEDTARSLLTQFVSESINALKTSVVVMITLLPLLFWHFSTVSLGSILLMGIGWWLFPLVFSSLIMGLLVGYVASSGIIYPSIISIFSVILLELPLVALSGLLSTSDFFSHFVIEPSLYLAPIIGMYAFLSAMLIWSSAQKKRVALRSNDHSQFLLALQGLY